MKAKYEFISNLLVNPSMYLCGKCMNIQVNCTEMMIKSWVSYGICNYKVVKLNKNMNKECYRCKIEK